MKRKTYILLILVFFASVMLLADFFHQEKTLSLTDNCPICQWQKDSVAHAGVFVFIISILLAIFLSLPLCSERVDSLTTHRRYSSRAPPWIQ